MATAGAAGLVPGPGFGGGSTTQTGTPERLTGTVIGSGPLPGAVGDGLARALEAAHDLPVLVAQAEGNHEIAILDVNSAKIERRVRVPGVGAVSHIAWSPNGRTIAFSGASGFLTRWPIRVAVGR